ncbi:MAG TPA: helix-turn-helix transcriptional regulator [Solirubrobacteraceae bacterium]|jgi:DNA-binding XRE family transcriptional regulator|nr:helix-turn-helix transcriptional regulator [Solirubrobacteraceae bacterium]
MGITEITDALTLAAVERAVRHQPPGTRRAVPTWAVYEHLGVSSRSRAARLLRAQLAALDGTALTRGKSHGVVTWELTGAGRRRLSRLRAKGELPELPESPQHRAWREARALAEQRIEGFRTALLDDVKQAHALLGSPQEPGEPPSDAWFELGERLHQGSKRLASATYCLHEWPEPDDAHADIDHHTHPGDKAFDPEQREQRRGCRAGRRNTQLWESDPLLVHLGRAVRVERQRQHMSAADFAQKVGVGKRLIVRLEAGEANPDYELLFPLARALNLKPAVLFDRAREAKEGLL